MENRGESGEHIEGRERKKCKMKKKKKKLK
jgi:hypothetical protein